MQPPSTRWSHFSMTIGSWIKLPDASGEEDSFPLHHAHVNGHITHKAPSLNLFLMKSFEAWHHSIGAIIFGKAPVSCTSALKTFLRGYKWFSYCRLLDADSILTWSCSAFCSIIEVYPDERRCAHAIFVLYVRWRRQSQMYHKPTTIWQFLLQCFPPPGLELSCYYE